MSNLLDTKKLEKHVLSIYNKVIPIMKKDRVYVPLSTVFSENILSGESECCFADANGYHFRVLERGKLYRDDNTKSIIEITYWAIDSDIFNAASIYESRNRIPNQDFRRIMFVKRLEYFEAIGPEYARKARSEIETILKKAPFSDQKS